MLVALIAHSHNSKITTSRISSTQKDEKCILNTFHINLCIILKIHVQTKENVWIQFQTFSHETNKSPFAPFFWVFKKWPKWNWYFGSRNLIPFAAKKRGRPFFLNPPPQKKTAKTNRPTAFSPSIPTIRSPTRLCHAVQLGVTPSPLGRPVRWHQHLSLGETEVRPTSCLEAGSCCRLIGLDPKKIVIKAKSCLPKSLSGTCPVET